MTDRGTDDGRETPRDEATPRYGMLIARIDAWTAEARPLHGERMQCREGCDACCHRHLSVVPLEAAALARAAAALDPQARRRLAEHLEAWDERHEGRSDEPPCPLLRDARCLLYDARPLICRTHGFPLRTRPSGDPDSGEEPSLVWCELNFEDADHRPVDERGVLDVDRINRALGAVQALAEHGSAARRVTLRRALDGVRRATGSSA